jgi:hypothetical protein
MNDEELRKLLQNSLAGRRAPTEIRERVVLSLRPRIGLRMAAAAAILLVIAGATAALLLRPAKANSMIVKAIEQHNQVGRESLGHAVSSPGPRDIAQTVSEANDGRSIDMHGLRDGGFTQLQAHQCQETGWAHVIYANSWLKVSCFILDAKQVDVSGGRSLSEPGVDAWAFSHGEYSVVAIRTSGIAKVWVADLRAEHLAAIALDAEQKRHQLQTAVFVMNDKESSKPIGAVIQGMPGVEGADEDPSQEKWIVQYDRRRVTAEEIYAQLMTSGFSPRGWERR